MRFRNLLALLLLGTGLSCASQPTSSVVPTQPEPTQDTNGQLQVLVYWDEVGLADRQVEVVELELAKRTNSDGIAEFELPPGTYTLRALVNTGGPSSYRDFPVTVEAGQTATLKVLDCLPCL